MENVDQADLLKELKEYLLKLPTIRGTWWSRNMRGLSIMEGHRISTMLIHLACIQQDRIDTLEREVAELRERIVHLDG